MWLVSLSLITETNTHSILIRTWSSYNVSSSTSAPVFSSSPPLGSTTTVDASCALLGRNITVSSNSTCISLSTQFSVSPQDILDNNPSLLPSDCASGIAAQTKLCLPQTCTLYTPKGNSTCDDIISDVNSRGLAGAHNITTAQLERCESRLISAECLTDMPHLALIQALHAQASSLLEMLPFA